jgi:20S proteasome alpha/beta subunit
MAGATCALLLLSLIIVAEENPMDNGVVHGTINIALGNKNGLVVLTDSMLTAIDTAGTHQLPNPGQKLFKLDDRTVCAVAGFISAPAASARFSMSDLNTNTSAIIREYVRQSAPQSRQSIAEKLRTLTALFRLHLAMIANVRSAAGGPTPINAYRFQLIVAGYDIDDKPKIGRIVLRTENGTGTLTSEVEDFSLINVEERLVW